MLQLGTYFGNAFGENPDSQLTRVVRLNYVGGKVSSVFQLEKRNLEYTEVIYSYGAYVRIFEIRDQRKVPVNPEP
ncbi:hypothetical protein [Burkholderia sp. BCC0322]|uniref:hypothetical protein n=1 Tax=unclassified Burkholderia TaxID=2613784 RepID=UPI001588D828|nr:hypothetical protein [Burkholderia sp. BCC0322]